MKKIFLYWAILILSSSFVFAADLYVDSNGNDQTNSCIEAAAPCKTIAHALSIAEEKDRIVLGSGTFNENVIINENKRNIIIKGQGDHSSIIQPAAGTAITIQQAYRITIQDVRILTTNARAILIKGAPSGFSSANELKILGNVIEVNGNYIGIDVEQVNPPHSSWEISRNTILMNVGRTMRLRDVSESAVNSNILTIINPTDSSNFVWETVLSNIYAITFKKNIVYNGFNSGAAFLNNFGFPGNNRMAHVIISENTFEGWRDKALRLGIRTENVGVYGNLFMRNNQALILVNDGSEVLAEENYWGGNNPSNYITSLSSNVDYSPWYTDKDMTALNSVNDITPPVITLIGANPQIINLGTAYTELGAAASDNVDGDITENIIIDTSTLNVNTAGSYSVIYRVSDSERNNAQRTRTVNVVAPAPAPPSGGSSGGSSGGGGGGSSSSSSSSSSSIIPSTIITPENSNTILTPAIASPETSPIEQTGNEITGAAVGTMANTGKKILIAISIVILIGLVWRFSLNNPFRKGKPSARYE